MLDLVDMKKVKLKIETADGYLWRGHANYDRQHYDEAISDYTEAIRLNPADIAVLYEARGRAYQSKRDMVMAAGDFAMAMLTSSRCR